MAKRSSLSTKSAVKLSVPELLVLMADEALECATESRILEAAAKPVPEAAVDRHTVDFFVELLDVIGYLGVVTDASRAHAIGMEAADAHYLAERLSRAIDLHIAKLRRRNLPPLPAFVYQPLRTAATELAKL